MGDSAYSRTRYVIYGAGSIGCAVGGLLVDSGSRVLFVARRSIATAIAKGFEVKTEESDIFVKGEVVTELDRSSVEPGDVLIVTLKSQDTRAAVENLRNIYDPGIGIVCLQNGVSNEQIVSENFSRVYGGLLLISTVQLDPALVTIKGNKIAIGCYPNGADSLALELVTDLGRAGFEAIVSTQVMSLKWAKLIANLNNASHAITGYWLEKSAADSEMRALMLDVREEGLSVLDAAGIPVEPPDGEPCPIRIREDTAKLRLPRGAAPYGSPERRDETRTYPSMLQDLMLGRKANEADFLNGEIVRLGERLGIPTPYNLALIETLQRMANDNIQPGAYSPAELHAILRARRTD